MRAIIPLCVLLVLLNQGLPSRGAELLVSFGEASITPDVAAPQPVWLAGYGPGRRATGVHDPLMVRCVLLRHGDEKVALLSVDLVGLQYPAVKQIRDRLPDYRYVMVASTHNHEGPDVIGIWGGTPFQRGVNDDYVRRVIARCEESVRAAEQRFFAARVEYGTATDESLLSDSRQPYVKDGVLRVLRFVRTADNELGGILVQWNCHPESLGRRNTLVTADFTGYTVAALSAKSVCPVAYFSGALGGLMSNPGDKIRNSAGQLLDDGNFEYAQLYGEAVAELAGQALQHCQPVTLTPFVISSKAITVPIENQVYRAAREIGVLRREARAWTGDPESRGDVEGNGVAGSPMAVETEVAYLRLGDVHVACIPGELYPELVYGRIQDPPDPGADFPDALLEPAVTKILPGTKWLLFGLANDEIGYIIPRRQWDEKPPYCYGRLRSQYGEINSCGPTVAPIIMEALAKRVAEVSR